jgi:hypothetical protein
MVDRLLPQAARRHAGGMADRLLPQAISTPTKIKPVAKVVKNSRTSSLESSGERASAVAASFALEAPFLPNLSASTREAEAQQLRARECSSLPEAMVERAQRMANP